MPPPVQVALSLDSHVVRIHDGQLYASATLLLNVGTAQHPLPPPPPCRLAASPPPLP